MEELNTFYPLKEQTEILIALAFEVHNYLGFGFLEIVYKDALEFELDRNEISYQREKEFIVKYKEYILPHRFFADFFVYDQIILDVKAKSEISKADLAQTLNYLKCSGSKVGLILNFGASRLGIKRIVF